MWRPALFIGIIIALFIGGIAYERMLWNECRQANSWFYCIRVLGK